MSSARIPALLRSRCPTAIRWFVIAFIILSLDAVFGGWAWSHVLVEIFNGEPPRAHFDPFRSVISVSGIPDVIAAREHPAPNPVLWRLTQSMPKRYSSDMLIAGAAARDRPPGSKAQGEIGNAGHCSFTARAEALPNRLVVFIYMGKPLNGKPINDKSRNILESITSFLHIYDCELQSSYLFYL